MGYDLGVGKVGAEQDHVTGIRSTEIAPRVGDGTDTAATLAAAHQMMPTSDIAAARGVDPKKFAQFQKQNPTAFQAQQPGVVKECNYTAKNEYCPKHGLDECSGTGMYESDLARIKSLALLKISESGESFGDAYLQKAASGAPGRWMISQDQAKAELARRAAGGTQTVSAPEPAVSSEPFVPRDYQTKVAGALIINFRNQYSKNKGIIDLYCTLNYELGDVQHKLLENNE